MLWNNYAENEPQILYTAEIQIRAKKFIEILQSILSLTVKRYAKNLAHETFSKNQVFELRFY